jgi:DNA helicase IV
MDFNVDLKEQTLEYQVSKVAQLFCANVFYTSLSLNTRLRLYSEQGLKLEYALIEDDIQLSLNEGYCWDTLVFTAQKTKTLFGGVNKQFSHQFVYAFHIQQQVAKRRLNQIKLDIINASPTIKEAFDALEVMASQKRYIRHQEASAWLVRYSAKLLSHEKEHYLRFLAKDCLVFYQKMMPFLEQGHDYIANLNQRFVTSEINRYDAFFNQVETKPLTTAQRNACVTNEQFNLVLAGAGTGKTSTMIARAGYLVQAHIAEAPEILMLAYGKKASEEMQSRISERLSIHININTFHSLGLSIIGQVESAVPSIHQMAIDGALKVKFVDDEIKRLIKLPQYQDQLVDYFHYHSRPYKSAHAFSTIAAYTTYIIENELRTLNGELVKSYEECEIANYLYRHGIHYLYEAKYKIDTKDAHFKSYCPDFYLPDYDIYIEHFALNSQGHTPSFINEGEYLAGIDWKRKLHQTHQTIMIETYSYLKQQGRLTDYLHEQLIRLNVTMMLVPSNQLLNNLKALGLVSAFSKLMSQILSSFKAAGLSLQQLYEQSKHTEQSETSRAILQLFEPIYTAYSDALVQSGCIDFDDMIQRATQYVRNKQFISPYTHILVDEFQDIAESRAELIQALLDQQQNATLFCVGDDWQSIYQFSGSDIAYTSNFEAHFGHTATSILDKTFRFNNKINDVATKFITQNPAQIQKNMECLTRVAHEAISIIRSKENIYGVVKALELITTSTKKPASVLLLARFNHSKPDLSHLSRRFPSLRLQFMTVHASKGKEADFVILLDLVKGEFGFPAEKVQNPLLKMLLPSTDTYPHSEERRLFYVALTRARHHVYLITHPHTASIFIREMLDQNYPVIKVDDTNPEQSFIAKTPCPACTVGTLTPKDSSFGSFFGCSNYPVCKHTMAACPRCGNETIKKLGFNRCVNKRCDYQEPICPKCISGTLKLRSKHHKSFWGCSNYQANSEFSCSYTTAHIPNN